MIFQIDTEKDNALFIRGVIKAIESHLRNPISVNEVSLLDFDDENNRAFINDGAQYFGEYNKGAKDQWYHATCIIDSKGELFATPESCKKWLTNKYKELIISIIPQQ